MEVSPTVSRDQQLEFIDKYRQTQADNTAQIGEIAHALGSDLDSPYGGLHGPSEYTKSRYQTPQTESRIAGLRTAAQLSALNQLMTNEQNKWQERYNKAYLAAKKRQRDNENAAKKGNVTSDPYEEYEGQSTIGISSNEDRFATSEKPRVTNVSENGAYSGGYPTVVTTIDTPGVKGSDEVVGRYGSTQNSSNTPTVKNVASSAGKALSAVYGPFSWPIAALSELIGRM